ncbi:immunity 49 family protein [Streptomyces chilikensis]|uniref:Immunity 49 family protein n=1 Tax=Streptomyces chilikensis TaxID=1194079 RepID=A0ABV3EYT0_9ACTN
MGPHDPAVRDPLRPPADGRGGLRRLRPRLGGGPSCLLVAAARPGLAEKLIAAIQGSRSGRATVVPRGPLQDILHPPVGLFHRFLSRDEEGFNQALTEGLELHKAYWTSGEDRAKDPARTLPLSLSPPPRDHLPRVRRRNAGRGRIRPPPRAPRPARPAGWVPGLSRLRAPGRGTRRPVRPVGCPSTRDERGVAGTRLYVWRVHVLCCGGRAGSPALAPGQARATDVRRCSGRRRPTRNPSSIQDD